VIYIYQTWLIYFKALRSIKTIIPTASNGTTSWESTLANIKISLMLTPIVFKEYKEVGLYLLNNIVTPLPKILQHWALNCATTQKKAANRRSRAKLNRFI